MKKRLLITVLIVVTNFFSIAQTPVYLNFVSHNEISDPLNYRDSVADYNTIKPLVKELCDTIISKQAKYNMQVDGNFIVGVLKWDNGATNPNDILEWANNSTYIDVDGHNHFNPLPDYADVPNHENLNNPYNYSDLAHLLDSCGVVLAHNILGGITAADTTIGTQSSSEQWTQYILPKQGFTFTNHYWQADILWGGGTIPGHVADMNDYGIWKPLGGSSPTEFRTHDPSQILTYLGGGCKDDVSYNINKQTGQIFRSTDEVIANIKSIVDEIQNIPTSANDFYTMNMLINFRDIPQIPSFADSIGKIIDGLQDYVNQGKIVWATLGEKYDLWYQQHSNPNDYFNYRCENLHLNINEIINKNEITLYPNPTTGIIQLNNINSQDIIYIYDIFGKTIYQSKFKNNAIDISGFANGIYFIKVGEYPPEKIIKY